MIPDELKAYNQWVMWRYELANGKHTKVPYSPHSGGLASVTSPNTWSNFDHANLLLTTTNLYSGIGFVLTDSDPFCVIDFDATTDRAQIERQIAIAEQMNTYSEVSPSGKGLHLWCKANLANGRKRNGIEIYTSLRYMTVTGQTYHQKPIAEREMLASRLWEELGGATEVEGPVINQEQRYNDREIYDIAMAAENGDKFFELWNGNWQAYYKSQSEADYAIINIIQFYSKNKEQIKRMFRASGLGQRPKALRDAYVNGMLNRSFDRDIPILPMEQLRNLLKNRLEQKTEVVAEQINPFAGPLFQRVADPGYDWTIPPGLLGDITNFVYNAAPRPVKEIALGAAIGLMAGICGRSYNVSGTGLNQYVLILAKTGVGKEGAKSGIDKLMNYVRHNVPPAMEYIGPAEIASGQALIKYLGKHPCFLSIVGEFGLALQNMCSIHANINQIQLRRILLALYNQSGSTDVYRETVYSDQAKNSPCINSPSFSLIGESTPEAFYEGIDETMIKQGLLPRFTCVEYLGDRPPLNEKHREYVPPQDLVTQLSELTSNCLIMAQNSRVIHVELDKEAAEFSTNFNLECDTRINGSQAEIARQLWNRAHIKALKLAALIAIGKNYYDPIITLDCMQWSKNLIERDINNVMTKFDSGKIGKDNNELNQLDAFAYMVKEYIARPYDTSLSKYGVTQLMHSDRVLPMSYVQRRLLNKGAFSKDRLGANSAIKRSIEMLCSEGVLRELRAHDIFTRYQKTCKAYMILDISKFI